MIYLGLIDMEQSVPTWQYCIVWLKNEPSLCNFSFVVFIKHVDVVFGADPVSSSALYTKFTDKLQTNLGALRCLNLPLTLRIVGIPNREGVIFINACN